MPHSKIYNMKKILFLLLISFFFSCQKYLDVIPDNIATIENAFSMRNTAERYLFTCYSWMPSQGNLTQNPALLGGDELWAVPQSIVNAVNISRGQQNVNSPLINFWDGSNNGVALFRGIRDCNIFLDNVHKVPDMEEFERLRWIAEVKFLKAYYHFYLMRMYGPIPISRESLPIDASIDQVRVYRESVDDVVDYIVELLDEASTDLPNEIDNPSSEAGRITKPIALSIKAYVLTVAASPLFNGNKDYVEMLSEAKTPLFNQNYEEEKWAKAAKAAKEAIDLCHQVGISLYEFQQSLGQTKVSDTTKIQMSLRNAVTERFNEEVIWGNPNSLMNQAELTPRTWDPTRSHASMEGKYSSPLKIAELFYSDKGVPIQEDKTFDYENRYQLRTAVNADKYNIKEGYTTAGLHFNRENRFYSTLGFDGGIWYGQGRLDDNNPFYIQGKGGQAASIVVSTNYSVTGYWPKKLINYQNVVEVASYTTRWYAWPNMRLADLYLLYAEALNESSGPTDEVYNYLNLVRERAGLETVQSAWTAYSKQANKYKTKEGLRQIIQQERMIELSLEGHRFWDLRRWKLATEELSKPITGWSIHQKDEAGYYREAVIFNPVFRQKDYLWPLSETSILRNDNLIQNTGW